MDLNTITSDYRLLIWLSFIAAFFISPWSTGFMFYLAGLIIAEIMTYCYKCYIVGDEYQLKIRIAIIISSIAGFITGRFLLSIIYTYL